MEEGGVRGKEGGLRGKEEGLRGKGGGTEGKDCWFSLQVFRKYLTYKLSTFIAFLQTKSK